MSHETIRFQPHDVIKELSDIIFPDFHSLNGFAYTPWCSLKQDCILVSIILVNDYIIRISLLHKSSVYPSHPEILFF